MNVNFNACCSDYYFEICAVKLHSVLTHICVFSTYRAPKVNFTHFLHKVDIIFLFSSKIEFIFGGDNNTNYLTDTHRKNQTHC